MSWSIGYDSNWKRDIGYGVPAQCDYPGCEVEINRGLGHVCCDQEPYGGDRGCGLYFCSNHADTFGMCERCETLEPAFEPSPDLPEWLGHKQSHPSWEKWRQEQ